MLVRVDGLMIALWLSAALFLVPSRLERSADRLCWRRAAAGGLLLLGSVLAKPTAVLCAAPLVLGWLAVDRRSALRLVAVVCGVGLLALLALQVLTSGGFLWAMGLWRTHPLVWRQVRYFLGFLVRWSWPALIFVLLGAVFAWRAGARPWREGAFLLVAGGAAVLPSVMKAGAGWNYLLPLLCATIVWGCRCWSDGARRSRLGGRLESAAAALGAVIALALVILETFPLPTAEDRATADASYTFLRKRGKPILALGSDYIYFLLDQPVEAEGGSLLFFQRAHVQGSEKVKHRIERSFYRVILSPPRLWSNDPPLRDAVDRHYRLVAVCRLGSYYGGGYGEFLLPAGEPSTFAPPRGARCDASGRRHPDGAP